MINLLPDEYKKEVRAARINVILIRYIMIMLSGSILLGGLVTGGYFTLNTARAAAEQKVAENEQRVAKYRTIKEQTEAFRNDLTTAKSILDNELSYAKLIYKIADIVPKNVVLDNLSLDPKTFGSDATMNASAKTFDDATKLKDAFITNSEIFSNVQFQRLEYSGSTDSTNVDYPVKVHLTVVINKGALQ